MLVNWFQNIRPSIQSVVASGSFKDRLQEIGLRPRNSNLVILKQGLNSKEENGQVM